MFLPTIFGALNNQIVASFPLFFTFLVFYCAIPLTVLHKQGIVCYIRNRMLR
jgi:hypothetical protein